MSVVAQCAFGGSGQADFSPHTDVYHIGLTAISLVVRKMDPLGRTTASLASLFTFISWHSSTATECHSDGVRRIPKPPF